MTNQTRVGGDIIQSAQNNNVKTVDSVAPQTTSTLHEQQMPCCRNEICCPGSCQMDREEKMATGMLRHQGTTLFWATTAIAGVKLRKVFVGMWI